MNAALAATAVGMLASLAECTPRNGGPDHCTRQPLRPIDTVLVTVRMDSIRVVTPEGALPSTPALSGADGGIDISLAPTPALAETVQKPKTMCYVFTTDTVQRP